MTAKFLRNPDLAFLAFPGANFVRACINMFKSLRRVAESQQGLA